MDGGGGGEGGRGRLAWSRKENKPSKSEAAFSRRGPDMCLVMQQPPHQPKLGLTEVIKRRGKREGQKKEAQRDPAPLLAESAKVRFIVRLRQRGKDCAERLGRPQPTSAVAHEPLSLAMT